MRTYDDTFSGQKIYPGKVRLPPSVRAVSAISKLRKHSVAAIQRRETLWILNWNVC